MKTILLPVDYTDGNMMTVKYAIRIAGATETRLHLFHIYPDQLLIPDSSFPTGIDSDAIISSEFIIELRNQAEENMLAFHEQVDKFIEENHIQNIEVSHLVTGGDPEWEIREVIQSLKPYLIVMGTRGEGKKGFLEGSMAEKIMVSADIPVLAVPHSIEDIQLHNIMYATNFNENDFERITSMINIFDAIDPRVHIVHFELKKRFAEDRQLMDTLQVALQNEFPGKKLSFHLLDSTSKGEAIKRFTEDKGVELIAFIAHKSNLFTNLFSSGIHKKDFFKLELPMLAMEV